MFASFRKVILCLLLLLMGVSNGIQMMPSLKRQISKKNVISPKNLNPTIFSMNKILIDGVKSGIDIMYKGRDIERFYTLETVARVPYFAFCSALHLRETLGDRSGCNRLRLHYAQQDNEYHHLCIMEALLGNNTNVVDRFIAQGMACGFYWYCALCYLIFPSGAIHLSELIEAHAYATYSEFIHRNQAQLKSMPVPAIAHDYYSSQLFEILWSFSSTRKPLTPLRSLYDVFLNIRDDELGHWATLTSLVQFDQSVLPQGYDPTPTKPLQN